jgi:hypothetical protein
VRLATLFNEPFTELSSAGTLDVPGKFSAAIAGRVYKLDPRFFGRRSLPVRKEQQDTSQEPGEQSLSPLGLWPRSVSSWHLGAGQEWLDLEDSDRRRFRASKGFLPWNKGKLTLLPGTVQKRASVNTNLRGTPVGSFYYLADGTELYRTTDFITFTAVGINVAEGAQTVQRFTTNGFDVWAAVGPNDIHRTERGASTSTHYARLMKSAAAVAAEIVAFVKGRLMAAALNHIWNVTVSGDTGEPLFTHPNTDFRWVGFAAGPKRIYAAGNSGDKSEVYRLGIKEDGTGLDAPIEATPGLPDGEIVRSIDNYVGFIVLGTDKGWRFCIPDRDTGDLDIGALIETNQPVHAFEGQGTFLWFSWKNYDGDSTGVGRADLRTFTDAAKLAPAYASDLMAAGQGDVLSISTFNDKLVFTVAGLGVYQEDANLVAEGKIEGGKLRFGLTTRKVFRYLDASHEPLPAGSKIGYQVDIDGTLTPFQEQVPQTGGGTRYDVGAVVGEVAEKIITGKRATDTTKGPTIGSLTLRSRPVPPAGELIILPLILRPDLETDNELPYDINPQREYEGLKLLERDGRGHTVQILSEVFEGYIENVEWAEEMDFAATKDLVIDSLEGICLVTVSRFDT